MRSFSHLALVAALAVAAARAGAAEAPLRELPEAKLAALAPLLRHGEMALIESKESGRLRQITVLALVAASPQQAYEVVTTPERWKEFGRNLKHSEVHRQPDGAIDYDFAIDLGVTDFWIQHRMRALPNLTVDMADRYATEGTNYRWRFLPAPGGTVAVLYGYTDVAHHGLLKRIIAAAPTMEHGLALSTSLYYMRSIKGRAEGLATPGSFSPPDPAARGPGFQFLLDRGQVAVIRSRADGRLGDLSILDVVHAPRQRLESAILDPRAYSSFLEGMRRSVEVARRDDTITYATEFDISLLSFASRYTLLHHGAAIDIRGDSGDFREARYRWDLTARGEKETLAVFRANQDLSRASPIVLGSLFRREPLFEHGIGVGLGLVQMAGFRARAEGTR